MQVIDIDAVTEKVADFLMQRQDMDLPVNEEALERILTDEVGADRVDELYDRVWARPVIRDTLEVAAMTFDLDKPVVRCGGRWTGCKIAHGQVDYFVGLFAKKMYIQYSIGVRYIQIEEACWYEHQEATT